MKKLILATSMMALLTACECGVDGKRCHKERCVEVKQEALVTPLGTQAVAETVTEADVVEPYAETRMVVMPEEYVKAQFAYNSSKLDHAAKINLDAQANWMLENPSMTIIVEGHCDERGTREYNLALGERRANAAKNYLILKGIDENRITTVSYGKDRPLVLGSNEEAYAQNRATRTVLVEHE